MLWSQVVVEIGWDLVEESREQYLRYTVDVIQRLQYGPAEKTERAIAALEIISLLTKKLKKECGIRSVRCGLGGE